jgi:hypothetical protein
MNGGICDMALTDNESYLFDRLSEGGVHQAEVVFQGAMCEVDGVRRFTATNTCDHDWRDIEGNLLGLNDPLADQIDAAIERKIGALIGRSPPPSSLEPENDAQGTVIFNVPVRTIYLRAWLRKGSEFVKTYGDQAAVSSQDPTVARNESASAIIANVVRRLIRNQGGEYERARAILDGIELSGEARRVVEEERAVVSALHATIYDQNGNLRVDEEGISLDRKFIESKVLNLKANPYRSEIALLLRAIFLDLRRQYNNDNAIFRRVFRELFLCLRYRKAEPAPETKRNESETFEIQVAA